MTEELEAHVLKKYEILQKLGKSIDFTLKKQKLICLIFENAKYNLKYRKGSIWYSLESH